jgi:alanine dehydrogenase
LVERNAGAGAGISDMDYANAGAEICETCDELYARSELIVKVKEPLPEEFSLLKQGQILFTFFHFAADAKMTETLVSKKVHCFAYELVEEEGNFPILAPMSEIAGRLAPQQGAKYLEKEYGGKGILLSGGYKSKKGKVVVMGGGVVGMNAALISCGMGADVVIFELSPARASYLEKHFGKKCRIQLSSRENIEKEIKDADVIVGAVMVAGAKAPKVLKKEDLKDIEDGSVLVDVAIDQGGCFETSRPTNHTQPIFIQDGVIHYCVANMPGVVPRTSTYALVAASTPYAVLLADKGIDVVKENLPLSKGYAIGNGRILSGRITL